MNASAKGGLLQAIWMEVAQLDAATPAGAYASRDALESGAASATVAFQVSGAIGVDEIRWRVRDASGSIVHQQSDPGALAGIASWNGRSGAAAVVAGRYAFELEAYRMSQLLASGGAVPFTIVSVELAPGGSTSGEVLVFVPDFRNVTSTAYAFTVLPSSNPWMGNDTIAFARRMGADRRVRAVAHELGHALENGDRDADPGLVPSEFYPTAYGRPHELVLEGRRLTQATETVCRTMRGVRSDRRRRVDTLQYLVRSSAGDAEVIRRLRAMHDASASPLHGDRDVANALALLSGAR